MKFTTEHEQIRDTVKRFIVNEVNPHVKEWEQAQQYPAHQVMKRLGDLGLLGLKYPEKFGGAELDFSYSMVMAEALGFCDCRRRADVDRRADRHGHAGAGPLRLRRAAQRMARARRSPATW